MSKEEEYELFLTPRGHQVYKGGNIEVLKPIVGRTFKSRNDRAAYHKFHNLIGATVGSGSTDLFGYRRKGK